MTTKFSANPDTLQRYAQQLRHVEAELKRGSAITKATCAEFDAVCREPQFRQPPLAELADGLLVLAQLSAELTDWVLGVADRVRRADQVAATTSSETVAHAILVTPAAPAALPTRTVLLQSTPDGDPAVLTTVRYEAAQQFEIGAFSGQPIRSVGDHIREYGCLLTSYAMVLRDAGAKVTVADLYKANYEAMTLHSFDQDAAHGAITLFSLDSTPDLVQRAMHDAFRSTTGWLGSDPVTHLQQLLEQAGPIIVQTQQGSEHWIVVDTMNADGTFNVRDPLRGARQHVHIGITGDANYVLAADAAFSRVFSSL